ncbi:hypothetical protein F0422_20410 [Salmonella enterica]|uniref:Uncharacterized protein n=2 Tax=Salmonella enterica I TaxID=59201 RepID=A0A738NJ12_SALPT|nr:hypothetical protein [Salmonella enterica]EBF9974318.1 hypothetical protein [Salmonella enterica subsp. enterica serovar Typhi]EBG9325000.1 hypothetical protein [Salmonella enterica subsp. enterica serovar Paratyphi A]ECB4844352.1 hypothetical protein [Salmonella enterica subsp. enterica serovar Liverpool]ECD5388258.1 hypothetical protein [Salmonella enterica subsp. enterica serovar Anatum]EDE1791887.1 hypothetical protein [Salmonella enterica subsp. enterica serovar Enteritidis]EEN5499052
MFLPTLSSPVEDFSFQFVEVFHFVASPVAENLIKRNQISNTLFVKLHHQSLKFPGIRMDRIQAHQRS